MKTKHYWLYLVAAIGMVLTFATGCDKDDTGPVYGTVTDIDGNVYRTVRIGDQIWMAENLKTTRYHDATDIPLVTEIGDFEGTEGWKSINYGARCFYDNDDNNRDTYGALYNWYAVETGKLCPPGWHVPSRDEWEQLVGYLIKNYPKINYDNVANALKSCRQVGSPVSSDCNTSRHPRWESSESQHYGTDDFGFSALPGGYRYISSYTQSFGGLGYQGYWWSSTFDELGGAWRQGISYDRGRADLGGSSDKRMGFSVRCLTY